MWNNNKITEQSQFRQNILVRGPRAEKRAAVTASRRLTKTQLDLPRQRPSPVMISGRRRLDDLTPLQDGDLQQQRYESGSASTRRRTIFLLLTSSPYVRRVVNTQEDGRMWRETRQTRQKLTTWSQRRRKQHQKRKIRWPRVGRSSK